VDLAGEIASASGEQSKALGSVSDSMRQSSSVAQATSQQSAEIAAAADELSRQMKTLKDRMDKYRLGAARGAADASAAKMVLTPELIEQVLAAVQASRAEAPARAEPSRALSAREVLPLDRDERGFHGF
jgi:ABC-type transporter Mla subunit MlaD